MHHIRKVLPFIFAVLSASFIISCATQKAAVSSAAQPQNVQSGVTPPPLPPEAQVPARILGMGRLNASTLTSFLLKNNPALDPIRAQDVAQSYIKEGGAEGVNSDVAFAQMCVETGFLKYGGLVTPDMNNFAGLGSIEAGKNGESFPSVEIGVRAQVQHLKAYATADKPNQNIVDTRYKYVKYGSAPTVDKLSGSWAQDPNYGKKIDSMLVRMYKFADK
jgi:hypothetical protein